MRPFARIQTQHPERFCRSKELPNPERRLFTLALHLDNRESQEGSCLQTQLDTQVQVLSPQAIDMRPWLQRNQAEKPQTLSPGHMLLIAWVRRLEETIWRNQGSWPGTSQVYTAHNYFRKYGRLTAQLCAHATDSCVGAQILVKQFMLAWQKLVQFVSG